MPGGTAPLMVCFLPQLVSVAGDTLGQRCCRVCHGRSRRRFLLAMAAVTSLQMFLVILFVQVAFPKVVTPIQLKYPNGTYYDYCDTEKGRASGECYAQGPLSIHKAVASCPMLFLDPLINLFYYLGEAVLYGQSIGVILIVLAALTSSFILSPLQVLLALHDAKGVPVAPVIFGIGGALLCLVERTPNEVRTSHPEDESIILDRQSPVTHSTMFPPNSPTESVRDSLADLPFAHRLLGLCAIFTKNLPLFLPFSMLSFMYAMYFVMMVYYNEKCHINLWGYNAFDQMTVIAIMYPAYLLVDWVSWLRKLCQSPDEHDETFLQALRGAWNEVTRNRCEGLFFMFMFRLLINGRALVYTYIVTSYDLAASYLELTLIRVVLSWIASLLLVLVVPRFIRAEASEQRTLKDPINIFSRVAGTILIVVSLVFLHHET